MYFVWHKTSTMVMVIFLVNINPCFLAVRSLDFLFQSVPAIK